ncbi:hypothetical protein [uncultured Ferrimonas sp.]|uniref:hypothetical protein n=1 Tax=uncultured Ferrimonas sp. TaxID=432640 RepID=UPI0026162FCE|nr:hypothetical protein [uncultured Ferrimonas sp.]
MAAIQSPATAADAVTFDGNNAYAKIQPWQPQGDFKVIAWLGDLNPDAGAKSILLSNSQNSEYLSFYHTSVMGQWDKEYPGIWNKFNFAETKYLEYEIRNGVMTASDGKRSAQISNGAIDPSDTQFDWLFRRNGSYAQGSIEGLALIDMNNPANSRAYAFDKTRGMVEVGGTASMDALVNVDANDWQPASHTIVNPEPSHFTAADWQSAFYPQDNVTPEPTPEPTPTPTNQAAARFDGKQAYAAFSTWVPSGKFRVIAHLAEVSEDSGQRTVLLSSSNSSEFLGFSHNNLQGQWGRDYPGIWGKFNFDETKYIDITVDHGKMTASDGKVEHSVNSGSIDPTLVGYDWAFRRNNSFNDGALQSITLIDYNNPSNSRSYAFDAELGMVEVNGQHGQVHGVEGDNWIDGSHQISNPAPEHFSQSNWDKVYGGESQPEPTDPVVPEPTDPIDPVDPEPTDPVLPEPTEPTQPATDMVYFDGNNNYGEIAPWTPKGRFKVIAWLGDLDTDAGARTILLSSSESSEFLGFSHNNVQGRWDNKYPGIWGKFDFNASHYIELTVDNGSLTASDGKATATINDASIDPTGMSYDWLFRRGYGDYSKGELQALTLIDYADPANSRSYAFSKSDGMVEVNGNSDSNKLHNVESGDWSTGTHSITNPDESIFPEDKWDTVYGPGDGTPVDPSPVDPTPVDPEPTPEPVEPTPEPVDPEPTPEPTPEPVDPEPTPVDPPAQPDLPLLAGDDAKAVRFDGKDGYLEISDWKPNGDFRVVAWLSEINPDANAKTYLLGASNGNYLAFSHGSVEGKWGGSTVRIDNEFAFDNTRYVEISVKNGELFASDGQTTSSTRNGAVNATGTSFNSVFRSGNNYSKGALQSLALIDYSNTDQVRGYYFNDQHKVMETGANPSDRNYLRGTESSDWINISSNVVAPKPLLNSQAEWDAQFNKIYKNGRPLLNTTNGNDQKKFAWEGHYWLRSYLTMAKTYNDDKYLDYAVELIDHMFNYTDEKRVQRGELNLGKEQYDLAPKKYLNERGTPAPGWRRPYNGWRIEVLSDGQILNAITRVADYIKSENKTKYTAKADQYFANAVKIIRSHDSSYSTTKNAAIQGSYFYVNYKNSEFGDAGLFSNPMPFNHDMTMGIAMIYVNKWVGDNTMAQRVRDIYGFFTDNLIYNSDGTCTWNYAFDKNGNNKLEDNNHAHLDVGFMVTAHDEGYSASTRDVKCLTKTLTDKVFMAPGMIHYDVAGNGISDRWDQIATGYDWDQLQQYDGRVLEMNKHVLRQYGQLTWYRPYLAWANVLYWQEQAKK